MILLGRWPNPKYQRWGDFFTKAGIFLKSSLVYILNSDLELQKSNFWDNFEGGQYQYAGISSGFGSLINTECFSIAKAFNEFGDHDGFIFRLWNLNSISWCSRNSLRWVVQNLSERSWIQFREIVDGKFH